MTVDAMSKNLSPFLATKNDLAKLLGHVMTVRSLQFVMCGLFDSPYVQSVPSVSMSDPATNYLVADRDLVVELRAVPQRNGRQKFAVDQLANPKTIVLRSGGLTEKRCLVAGQFGTI